MVMVERVSLWDRTETSPEDEVENVLRIFRDRHPDQSRTKGSAARSVARMSMRRPTGSGRKRRVGTRMIGRVMSAIAALAAITSAVVIFSKSMLRRTSRSDQVMAMSNSCSSRSRGASAAAACRGAGQSALDTGHALANEEKMVFY